MGLLYYYIMKSKHIKLFDNKFLCCCVLSEKLKL